MLQENKPVRAIAKALDKTRDCVRIKIARLGLEVVVQEQKKLERTTTNLSSLVLPSDCDSYPTPTKLIVPDLVA